MKIATKITALVVSLCTLLSVAGVYATWQYSTVSGNENIQIPIKLATFNYPEEQIPPTVKGVLGAIVDNLNDGGRVSSSIDLRKWGQWLGLADRDSWQKNMIGSMDKNWGNWMVSSLKNQYPDYPNNCSFIIDFSDENSYSVYITEVNLSSLEEGVSISPVYKATVVKENGSWTVNKYEVGSAVTVNYKTPRPLSSPQNSMGFDYREM